jgi:mRNA-degrading endonuclease RelE of RelBE toxin-antitoxin system
MDKIEKFLRKLSPKERGAIEEYVIIILSGHGNKLDVKKLRGYSDIYRVRKGLIRIIFRQQGRVIRILSISRRDEGTYRDF